MLHDHQSEIIQQITANPVLVHEPGLGKGMTPIPAQDLDGWETISSDLDRDTSIVTEV